MSGNGITNPEPIISFSKNAWYRTELNKVVKPGETFHYRDAYDRIFADQEPPQYGKTPLLTLNYVLNQVSKDPEDEYEKVNVDKSDGLFRRKKAESNQFDLVVKQSEIRIVENKPINNSILLDAIKLAESILSRPKAA
jgi:hypothetical protein